MNCKFILVIVPALVFLGITSNIVLAYEHEDALAKAAFDIQVHDIDLSTDVAMVNISIKFTNLFIEYLQPRENITAIIVSEINCVEIKCNRTSADGVFVGSSGITSWVLEGKLGKGEYFPFETYELVFRLANILPGEFNMTKIELDSSYSFISFEGTKKFLLARIFEVDEDGRILLKIALPDKLTVVALLSRKIGPLRLPSLFWSTTAPTLACFYLLASTLCLFGEKSLENRLLVYVSLFIFSPTFLMAMQEYLPLRASLSIPEVLLVSLLISTSVFTIISLIPVKTTWQELARDGIILFFATFSVTYFLTQLMPSFPASASSTFLYTLVAYGVVAYFIWNYRCATELLKPPRDIMTIILGILILISISGGFIFIAWIPFQYTLTTALGVVYLVIGFCLLQYRRCYRRRVWYWFFPEQEDSLKGLRKLLSLLRKYIHIKTKHKSEP